MAEPEIHINAIAYTVCALPSDHPDWYHFKLLVQTYGDTWVVCGSHEFYIGPAGDHDYMPVPAATHQYSLKEALRVARLGALKRTWQGKTAADILAAEASRG